MSVISTDKATVVSLCPFPINEFMPGLFPSRFLIAKALPGDIEILVIPATVYYRIRMPVLDTLINVPVPAAKLAESICTDRKSGQLLFGEDSYPGLFWVPGALTKEEVKQKYNKEIAAADKTQKNWFLNLVKMADDDWNKTHNHKFISDLQRHASKVLNLTREWNTSSILESTEKQCLACYSPMHKLATICPVCKVNQIDWAKANPTAKAG